MAEPFFVSNAKVHWGMTVNFALCGSGWLNSSHDRKQVTCPQCLEALAEITDEVAAQFRTWQGLMALLDEHYPATLFDGSSGDPGTRILVLTREIDRLRAAVRKAVMWSELNDEQLAEIEQLSGFTFEQLVRDACDKAFHSEVTPDDQP